MSDKKRDYGFLTIAQNVGEANYVKHAYALALSLKATQSEIPYISVMVDKRREVPTQYVDVFDEIIPIWWGDDGQKERWKIHNKWKAIYQTPYENTILLDADMLFPNDILNWWGLLEQKHVWASSDPITFRGEPIKESPYRDFFYRHDLPDIYTAFMYFDQSEFSFQLFETARLVLRNWDTVRDRYFKGDAPEKVSGDIAFSCAMKFLDVQHKCTDQVEFPQFVHMKSRAQGFHYPKSEQWSKEITFRLDRNNRIFVNNYLQHVPFHYHDKSLLGDTLLKRLEENANG